MDGFFEVLKLILPALIVFLTAFFVLKQFMDKQKQNNIFNLKQENIKIITPIRLQAHERLVLFLERIAPQSVVMRVHKTGMSARMLQSELLNTIRNEFEHNVSQQLYVSERAWELVKMAKEELIKMVNVAASKVNDDATGIDLSNAIFKLATELGELPSKKALDHLKQEIRLIF